MLVNIEQAGVTLLDVGDWAWEYDEAEGLFVHERKVMKKTLEEVLRDHGPVTAAVQTVRLKDYEDSMKVNEGSK